ncbi:hypothetical protein CFC21_104062 [Triticum aestivum]|uniref:Uncharacterized protein n=2 Tax=Triticum aestivum TaxID=4565 RepID=A0A9R1M9S7_WHEAT|nr:hypothetical protein CFC21_104062 [Triticum aestivum]
MGMGGGWNSRWPMSILGELILLEALAGFVGAHWSRHHLPLAFYLFTMAWRWRKVEPTSPGNAAAATSNPRPPLPERDSSRSRSESGQTPPSLQSIPPAACSAVPTQQANASEKQQDQYPPPSRPAPHRVPTPRATSPPRSPTLTHRAPIPPRPGTASKPPPAVIKGQWISDGPLALALPLPLPPHARASAPPPPPPPRPSPLRRAAQTPRLLRASSPPPRRALPRTWRYFSRSLAPLGRSTTAPSPCYICSAGRRAPGC